MKTLLSLRSVPVCLTSLTYIVRAADIRNMIDMIIIAYAANPMKVKAIKISSDRSESIKPITVKPIVITLTEKIIQRAITHLNFRDFVVCWVRS